MNEMISEGIYEVGFVDWNIRDFHSYVTDRGATYNSYLIMDEKIALIDAVKAPYWRELLAHIAAVTDPANVDYIICNHAEPDHSGALPEILKVMPKAVVVCDAKCREILSGYFDTSAWRFQIVKTGESLKLGRRSLSFVETPMVHWPDSMLTYMPEEKILFSMDAFGQHYASSGRFDDQVPLAEVMQEAQTYYANIVMPFGKQVQKTLELAAGLDIRMIAPSHGIIWRSHVGTIVQAYKDWCVCKPKAKVSIIYDSMWESTARMALDMYEGACIDGVDVKLLRVRSVGNTRIVADVLDSACVAFGSATLNQTLMPAAASLLTYLKGLRPVGKSGFAFGSHGWGRGGPEDVEDYLKVMNFELLREPLKCKWSPAREVREECRAAGLMLAQKALEVAARA